MNTQESIYNYINENINTMPYTNIITELLREHSLGDIEQIFDIEFDVELDIEETKKPKNNRDDENFRERVRNMYNNKCIITGVNVIICDVAHILEYSKCKTVNEKYDPYNGLLFSKNMHALFDKYYFSIEPNTYKIKLNRNKENIDNVGLTQYENKILHINDKSKKYLHVHYTNFLLSIN